MNDSYKIFSLILNIVLIFFIFSCSYHKEYEDNLEKLDEECSESLTSRNFEQADSLADLMEKYAIQHKSNRFLRKAYYYQGDYRDDLDSAELINREEKLLLADRLASESKDTLLQIKIYNSRGIWEMERQNYQTAQFFLKRGLEFAKLKGDMNACNVLESNFSEVSRMLEDTLGLQYDIDIFEKTLKTGNYLRQRTAAFHCTRYYLHPGGDTVALKKFIDVLAVDDTLSRLVPMIYAKYWLENGDYNKAYSYIIQSKYDKFYEAAIIYAEVLNRLGRYEESNEYVDALFEMYNSNKYDNQWIGLNRLAAANYRGLGNNERAYEYEHLYSSYSDSLFRQKLNDLTKRYSVEYGADKLEFNLKAKSAHVKSLQLLLGALIIIAILVVTGMVLYIRKRNSFYRSIVSQYLRQEDKGLNTSGIIKDNPLIQNEGNDNTSELKTGPSGIISEKKVNDLWKLITVEMDDHQIWRDKNLTRDSFAELLGCSHTYLTQIIRLKTGMPFSGYINSYRLREAKFLLTDLSQPDELSLKKIAELSGFSSLSNFYTLFKKDCGVPPAIFRRTARNITANGINSD